jgi:hypothetical protein
METIILAFFLILLAIGGLALGVMVGRAPIKGSCGGLTCVKGVDCGTCKSGRKHDTQTGETP